MIFLSNNLAPKVKLHFNPAAASAVLDLTTLPAGSYQVSVRDEAGHVVLDACLPAGDTHQLGVPELPGRSYSVLVRSPRSGEGFVLLTQRMARPQA